MLFAVSAEGHILFVDKWSICALFAKEATLSGHRLLVVRKATEQEAQAYLVDHLASMAGMR